MARIEISNLTKNFGDLTALDDVTVSLEQGQIVGLLGPNGSGKTTLIKILNGLLQPTSGSVTINGNAPGVATKKVVAYLPDRNALPDYMTASQLMDIYEDFFEDFDRLKAEAMIDDLGINRKQTMKKMSKGTKEKLQLCLVMARQAEVYLLDEPIGGVDPATRDYILRTIISNYNENAVVLISTHLIADVESVLDDVVFIKEGRVVLHKAADEIREERGESVDKLFREVFKC
ncbi:MAG: ABC transporter ATP-binding protein [Mogibacterium sp.]|nr:ABC transporter ATP-binding protein [Mogibacterium sp.]MBQ6501699.1 ABC transporter ATP-binding protein [Mogibacterium sp.]